MVDDRVGPVEQFLGVPVGHTEQLADHLDREPSSDCVDEVDLAFGKGPIDGLRDEGASRGLPLSDSSSGETARNQLSDPGVLGRVGFQHCPSCLAGFGVPLQFFKFGAPHLGGKSSMVAVDRH